MGKNFGLHEIMEVQEEKKCSPIKLIVKISTKLFYQDTNSHPSRPNITQQGLKQSTEPKYLRVKITGSVNIYIPHLVLVSMHYFIAFVLNMRH